ncbi:beta-ketoacyl-ACP synthase III [Rhodopirellula europaea]|jgi:3-oxoacyl-[acyl-carrier-protein] synthase-3|uniref:Beta-ketoacyl-[acyl-carrier-protein] synthase III n=1 Tax=Rhodopirellula europaea SH398 TaxID=1263868 RepID=M5SCZ2_9BACT|nr:beta-ketoacyl-ACP synthase III [Rhodopirellula europaea]EMI29336.1 3-oxoacyl-(acyl carrier protein) synthase III [Rhodopirellula europaea SH398]
MIETSSNVTATDLAAKSVNEESSAESTAVPTEAASTVMPGDATTRGRMGNLKGVRIAGTGSYVPERIVTNEDLAALGCDSDWIVRRTGILQRRHAEPGQATSDLCYEAALRCLENANVSVDEIDLILVATITPDHPTPSTACHLQRRLGAVAPAMDIGAACAGFMYALVTGAQFVSNGNARNVLVIGADLMSRTVDPEDKKTYPLFGDAAGAALLVPSTKDECQSSDCNGAAADSTVQSDGLLAYQLGSEGCGGEMLCIPAGGSRSPITTDGEDSVSRYLQMDGRGVFKWAVRVFDESAKDVLRAANVSSDQLSLVVLHQANQRIIDSAVSDLNVPPEKVFVNLDKYGNTSGASIPLALDEAARAGRLREGDLLLLCGFGAGLAWGTALLRW